MNKKIKAFALVAAVAAIGGYGVYTNQQKDVMSDLVLANVEALAKIEDPDDGGKDCHNTNGYTAFTGRSGGAYDCCYVWVTKAPNTAEGHCR